MSSSGRWMGSPRGVVLSTVSSSLWMANVVGGSVLWRFERRIVRSRFSAMETFQLVWTSKAMTCGR